MNSDEIDQVFCKIFYRGSKSSKFQNFREFGQSTRGGELSCRILLPHDSEVSFLPNCDYCVLTPGIFKDTHPRWFQYLSTICFIWYFMLNPTHLLDSFYRQPTRLDVASKLLMFFHPCRHNFSLTSQLLNNHSDRPLLQSIPFLTLLRLFGIPLHIWPRPFRDSLLCLCRVWCNVLWGLNPLPV
jgi:hypothetical protein